MKSFHSLVDLTNCIAIGVDEAVCGSYFYDCLRALTVALDYNPELVSPATEKVIIDFYRWFEQAQEDSLKGLYPQKPVFVYTNLNTGFIQVFVVTNSKGKVDLALA